MDPSPRPPSSSSSSSSDPSPSPSATKRRRPSDQYRILRYHVRSWALLLSTLDATCMLGFVSYGSYVLSVRRTSSPPPPRSAYEVSPPWLALILVASVSIFASLCVFVGIRLRFASLLIGQSVMQAGRSAILIIVYGMYIAWSARRRSIDNLNIPVSRRPIEFWTVAMLVFIVVICTQVFHFRIVTKTYTYLRAASKNRRTIAIARCDLENRSGGPNCKDDRPRISMVEEIFLTQQYLESSAVTGRRKSLLKSIDQYRLQQQQQLQYTGGSASDRIGAFPVNPIHCYERLPDPCEFGKWAVRKESTTSDRNQKKRRPSQERRKGIADREKLGNEKGKGGKRCSI